MRVISALTVLAAVMVVAGAGQTKETPQEIAAPSSKSLVVRFEKAVEKIQTVQKKVFCKGTKPYINLKRNRTWHWQDAMGVPQTRTSYADRRTKCSPYLKWIAKLWAQRADEAFRNFATISSDPAQAICHVFGNYCSEALTVARCESGPHLSIRATNGQYLGLFQMGDYARQKYGHSNDALGQARSAYEYFADSGYDWSPWSCKPYR